MTSREVGASRSTRRTRATRRLVRPLSPFIRALRPGHFFGPTDGTNHARRAVCNVHATRPPLGVVHWPLSLISPLTFTVCQAFVSTRSLQIVRLPSTPDEAARQSVGRSVGRWASGSFGSTERHMGLNVPHRGTVAAARRPGFWPSWRGGSWGRRHSTTETRGDQFITAQRVVNKPVPFFPLLAHFVTIYDLRASRAAGSCRRRIWRLIA